MVDIAEFRVVLQATTIPASTGQGEITSDNEHKALAQAILRTLNKAVPGGVELPDRRVWDDKGTWYPIRMTDGVKTVSQAETLEKTARQLLKAVDSHFKNKSAEEKASAYGVRMALKGIIENAENRVRDLKAKPIENELKDYIDKGTLPKSGAVREPPTKLKL